MDEDMVDAVLNLTRVTIALNSEELSRTELIRRFALMSIPPSKIAGILGMSTKDVTSVLSKQRKRRPQNGKGKDQ
jgi:hypothetical protein